MNFMKMNWEHSRNRSQFYLKICSYKKLVGLTGFLLIRSKKMRRLLLFRR